ncbi:MAG TPA: transporter [Bryobacteraceae bacterium]|nr:transporter [Bryobacteraceae bacterium]
MRVSRCWLAVCALSIPAFCQGNYEIQVYGSETVAPHNTMVELHSNFTFEGTKTVIDGLYPTEHQVHETIEITHGFTDWFETGFYIFTNAQQGLGWDFVGSHIRPRVRAPASWKLPVGLSLSQEIGWQKRQYSVATWTYELRPIIDKQLGRLYLSFNPTFDRAFNSVEAKRGFEFSPNFKAGWDFTKKVNMGVEYYGAYGPVTGFDPLRDQQQQIIPAIDLNLSPRWEFNAGLGVGVTQGTDHLLFKMIIGYRFNI